MWPRVPVALRAKVMASYEGGHCSGTACNISLQIDTASMLFREISTGCEISQWTLQQMLGDGLLVPSLRPERLLAPLSPRDVNWQIHRNGCCRRGAHAVPPHGCSWISDTAKPNRGIGRPSITPGTCPADSTAALVHSPAPLFPETPVLAVRLPEATPLRDRPWRDGQLSQVNVPRKTALPTSSSMTA